MKSGNSDEPPTSASRHDTADQIVREILDNHQAADTDFSPSGELYRRIERSYGLRRMDTRSGTESPNMASEPDPERRRRVHREATDYTPPFRHAMERPPHDRSARDLPRLPARRGARPPMTSSDRYLERHRSLYEASNGLADLQHAGRQLAAASSSLRALLDEPVPTISSPPLLARPDNSSDAEHNRRTKRRKLDTDESDSGFAAFRYGQYGQVEPGKLKMEIVSCDGGIFKEHHGVDYSAENVLKNDDSVYCTQSNRCNLVLRHQGATVFCLKELIVKAPHSGYTAPVQDGMVFVSMTSNDLLTRTAQYQIQYSPPRRRQEEEHSIEFPPIISINHNRDGTMTTAQARARRLYDIGVKDDECALRTAQIPADFASNEQNFNVTIECSESEDENSTARSRNRSIHRIMDLRFEDSDSEEGRSEIDWDDALGQFRRRETAGNITLAEAAEASQIATQEAVQAVGGGLMAPHARFFIERDKSKCTIRFDPPVSGRFILLKMWSPHPHPSGNIDIQSVVCNGFAGPRFFPAVKLR
ncbi:hypothetical protein B7494_g1935 [Chlorociboria aeruginascens]|nr:hypothetical protein B7494_g1935 [Chlorociboria aeruginascens]